MLRRRLNSSLWSILLILGLAGVLSGGGTGAVGFLPESYMAVKSVGQAAAGLVACVAQILCLQGNISPLHSAVIYFASATAVLTASQAGFYWLKRSV